MGKDGPGGYCGRKETASPDCAGCGDFSKEDIREELLEQASVFASLCFRIFHRDPQTRAMWRRKACRHFHENQQDASPERR